MTNDGIRYKMDSPFFIMATQNPIEQEGTYRLPEAQLDRFLFRIKLEYPSFQEEVDILKRFKNSIRDVTFEDVQSVLSAVEIDEFQQLIEEIKIQDADNHWHTYTIDDFFVINVQKEKIAMDSNEDKLLLITCYPFDSILSRTPFRYIVYAKKNKI